MEHVPLLLGLLGVDLLAVVSPGPNFLIVTTYSMQRGRADGIAAVLGILAANTIWVAAALFGLATLFELAPSLYGTMKIVGGCYLVYLAVRYWRAQDVATPHAAVRPRRSEGAFMRGLLTGLTNPKSLVYFGSVFTVFVGPSSPAWVGAVAAAIVLADGALWYGGAALFFGAPRMQRAYRALETPLRRAAGAVMGLFGVRLVLDPH